MHTIKYKQFEIFYKDSKYKLDIKDIKNFFIIELYRLALYHRLKYKFKKTFNKKKENNEIEIQESDNFKIYTDLIAILIFNNKKNLIKDPIFSKSKIFNIENLEEIIINNSLVLSENIINNIKKIFPKLDIYYNKYYKLIQKWKKKDFTDVNFEINYEMDNSTFILSAQINDKINELTKRKILLRKYIVPKYVFYSLILSYNRNVLNINNSYLQDNNCIICMYMIYNRYSVFDSGHNQASILPSFKRLIKEKIGVNVELFGSALNTNLRYFCSLFYDIEWMFGSLNDYNDTIIKSGYYEINPPFNKKIFNNILIKSSKELEEANINKKPLLFLFIIPYSYYKYIMENNLLEKINKYKSYDLLIKKDNFPYFFYSRDFKKMVVKSLINTKILIFNTKYINKKYLNNIKKFKSITNFWIQDNKIGIKK